ncbi:MAG: hypothetical protein ACI9DF_004575 [Verrucomicrobiales bacterium]|jgi:hypothetical protein
MTLFGYVLASADLFVPDALLEEPIDLMTLVSRVDITGLTLTMLPHGSNARYGGDRDGDSLPDFDEVRDLNPKIEGIQNPFDPNVADSTGDNLLTEPDGIRDDLNDFDGDGLSNYEELRSGMNPRGASEFTLSIRAAENQKDYQLEFDAQEGKSYQVEVSHDLKTWKEVASDHIQTLQSGKHQWLLQVEDAPGPDSRSELRYYRVRQLEDSL